MSAKEDQERVDQLISEIRAIAETDRVTERQSLTLITAKLAELIAIYNRQSNRAQRWMNIMTFVLIVLTIAVIFKM